MSQHHAFTLTSDAASNEIVAALRKYDVVHLPSYLSSETVLGARDEWERLVHCEEDWVASLDYSRGRAIHIIREELSGEQFPIVSELFESDSLREVAYAYLGDHVFNRDIYIVEDVVGSEHRAQELHYDRMPHLKFFFYLSDVSADQGPLEVVPSSGNIAMRREQTNRQRGITPSEDDVRLSQEAFISRIVSIEGVAGTLIIFHSDILHRAGVVRSGQRLAIRNRCLFPDDAMRAQNGHNGERVKV